MGTPFTDATKAALEDIILKHADPSKFGYFLTELTLGSLVDELATFVSTSRSLKAAGDHIIQKASTPAQRPPKRSPPPPQRHKRWD